MMKSVLDVIQATKGYLEKHAISNARLNAEHLLAHVLECRRMELYLMFDRVLVDAELDSMRELVRKRGSGVPLQHLLGTVEFHGAEYFCDGRALIPRPETEELVAWLVRSASAAPRSIVDVGTGSGVIACSLARAFPEAGVLGVDVSPDALALAEKNRDHHALQDRVMLQQSDLLSQIVGPFEWAIANLPYIETDTIPQLAREVRHDPVLALDGGADGLDLIRRLVPEAAQKLQPGGMLALEIGMGQDVAVIQLMKDAGFHRVESVRDLQNVSRFILGYL